MLHGAPLLGSRGVSGRLVCFFWWVLVELEHTRCELEYTSKWLVKRLLLLNASNCGRIRQYCLSGGLFAPDSAVPALSGAFSQLLSGRFQGSAQRTLVRWCR